MAETLYRPAGVMPLSDLPEHMRERVQREADAPKPPPRWRSYGPPGSPFPIAQIESRGWFEWHWQRGARPGESRPAIPLTLRTRVVERDGYVCQLCGLPVEPSDVHLDHIEPWSKGGRHTLANLQVTHSTCNIRKGARVPGVQG